MTATTHDTAISLFGRIAAYHGIDLDGVSVGLAYGEAATELRFPGYLAGDDPRAPSTYPVHVMACRALGVHCVRNRVYVPDGARCLHRSDMGVSCNRIRIPGFGACHWHGVSTFPDADVRTLVEAALTERNL